MNLLYEGFSAVQQGTLAGDYAQMLTMAERTLSQGAPLADWFGAADRDVLARRLRAMHTVVNAPNRTITFVNRVGGVLRVKYKSLYEPKLIKPGKAPEDLNGVLAYVFPTDRRDEFGSGSTGGLLSHVGSGMRIYIGNEYFGSNDAERASTIYHEVTHKVLATEDYSYDEADCLAFAATPAKAMRNAENYGFFLRHC